MALRSFRERLIQTVAFEAGGLLVATPVYALIFGASAGASLVLMVALAAAVLVWSQIHNTVFDWIDWRTSGRLASERPHAWRVVHAISHEASSIVVTVPILMLLGGHGVWEALIVDLGLTILYAVYAYLFHLGFDHLRPLRPNGGRSSA